MDDEIKTGEMTGEIDESITVEEDFTLLEGKAVSISDDSDNKTNEEEVYEEALDVKESLDDIRQQIKDKLLGILEKGKITDADGCEIELLNDQYNEKYNELKDLANTVIPGGKGTSIENASTTDNSTTEIVKINIDYDEILKTINEKADWLYIDEDGQVMLNGEVVPKLKVIELEAEKIKADVGEFKDLTTENFTATNAEITNLKSDYGEFKNLTTENFTAANARIETLAANKADIEYLTSNYATIELLNTNVANINTALIGKANVTDLNATNAIIEDLKASKADVADLTAINAKITNLEANKADVAVLEANYATIKQLDATNANVTNLQTETANINKALIDKADVADLNATNANVTNLQATKANVSDLNAAKANISTLTSDLAEVTTLVNGNLTSDNIQSMVITGEKFTVEDGFIKNAMIDSVNANKINAGSINTNNVSIQSNDGSMVLQGNLQQFKDKNGKVRIQIGKDAAGNFTFALYDEKGTGQLINQNGIQSSNAIADGLIVDSKVADNANIAGSKLDIDSVVTEVNNGSTSIKGTKIYLDDQKQSLNVAFNNMTNTVKGNTSTLNSHTTSINTMNGKITQLISDTTITKENGTTISLKDAYNTTVDTVNSHSTKIGSLETNLSTANNNISSVSSKQAALEQNLNGFKQTVSDTYTTKAEFDNLSIGGTNLLSSRNILKSTNLSGTTGDKLSGYLDYHCNKDFIKVEPGTKYYIKINNPDTSLIDCKIEKVITYNNGAYVSQIVLNNRASEITIPSNANQIKIVFIITGGANYDIVTKYKIKVEKGNRPTDWSPAPEDVDASIAAVDGKFANYSTTSQMNSAITQKANEITSSVSETYATKASLTTVDNKFANYSTTSAMNSAINQKSDAILSTVSKTYATQTSLTDVSNNLKNNYSTTSAMNSAINQKANEITSSVSETYATKKNVSDVSNNLKNNYSTTSAMNSAINQKANEITSSVSQTYATKASVTDVSNNLKNNYSTTSAMNSAINQKANEITSSVSETYATKTSLKATDDKFANYSTTSQMNSAINQKGDSILSTVSSNYTTKADFNGLQIGGTNLLPNSGNFKGNTGSWTSNGATLTLDSSVTYGGYPTVKIVGNDGTTNNTWIQLKPNTTYTYSVLAKASSAITGNNTNPLHMWLNTTQASEHLEIIVSHNSSIGTKWTKAWITFKTPNNNDVYYMKPFIYNIGSATVWLANAKVEEGNKATDWSPAPADIDASITAVDSKFTNYSTTSQMNSAINQKANEITSSVSSTYATKAALNTVDGKFANYSTTTDMNTAINQKADSITQSVSNTYATKTALNSANNNISSLTNRMSNAESKLTKDSLTTTIGSYYTTSSDVNGLITSQGYATTSQLSQTTDSLTAKFSESGGYNLLRNGRALNGTNYWADNGGGLNVSSSNPPTVDHKYFYTNLPSGMTYNGWVQLENNTHYIYSAKIFVPTSITGNKLEPLHYWCSSDQTPSKNQATPVRSSHDGQTIPANKWVDIWVEYVTASSGNVWFKPFIYQSISNCLISVTDLMLCKGSIPCPYSPHPSEIYDGITQINKDGIKVYHNSIDSNSYTHMSPTGFYLKNKGTDIFKVDGNGLYIKGNGDFTGKVTANDGSIGGFTISNGKLVGTGGNGVGMSGNGTDWAFWAGSNTGGNAPFHVGHEGNLYATQAYITGTITGSTINAGTINGATINSDSFIGDMLAIDGTISAKSLQVQDIDNAKYPGAVTADFKLYVSTSGNDDSEIENGATFATFDGLLDKLPRNLNGHEVHIEMSTNITENVDFKGFFGGKIRLYMKGHTLYGYVVSRMGSARINICSGYIGNASDTSNGWGKIHPSKGYAVSAYTTTVASVDQGAIGLYNIDVYGADNYLSGSTTKLGVAGQDWGTAYLNGVSYYGCDMGARANAGGRIHDVLSYNVCTKYGFYATTGGYITLAGGAHSGGKSKNYHEADAGKVIVASGATFASGEASVPGGAAPVVPTTKTITIKSTYGDTYRSSVYKSWKKDGTARQGDYGYGDCNGCWFFGDAFSDVEGKTISKVTIKITRQSGGSSSAVGLVVKSHGYSGRPSGAPTFRTTAGTLSLATGASDTLTITNSTILNEISSGKVKGFGIQSTYDSSHYAVCSGSCTVKITYTE